MRLQFMASLAVWGSIYLAAQLVRAQVAATAATPHHIQTQTLLLDVDRAHGRILKLSDKAGLLRLDCPSDLADNFRLSLRGSGDAADQVLGRDQKLQIVEEKNNTIVLRWKGPLQTVAGAVVDIDVVMQFESGQGGIEITLQAQNRSVWTLAEVQYPLLGGFQQMGSSRPPDDLQLMTGNGDLLRIDRAFDKRRFDYPSMIMPWVDLYSTRLAKGVYVGAHDPVIRCRSLQLDHRGGKDRTAPDLAVSVVHYPFTKPGEQFSGSALHLRPHEGDWYQACRFYRDWFTKQYGVRDMSKDWLRQATAVQAIMCMLPEGNINFRFKDIPQIARDGLRYGVKVLHLQGWHRGGHDNGYPFYDPDPRLGTWQDLIDGIAQCHKMGVKVLVFANVEPVDSDTDWYRGELYKYTEKGRIRTISGDGWGMGTVGARLSMTTRLMYRASPGFPAFRKILVDRFRRLAEAGADGIHLDKFSAGWLEFNPEQPLSPDQLHPQGAWLILKETLEACRSINPDFCVSAETYWDGFLSFGGVVWWGRPDIWKYTFPEWTSNSSTNDLVYTDFQRTPDYLFIGINMSMDYLPVNESVRMGQQLLISPHHYTATMATPDWAQLAEYIREINRIREELKETIYMGEYVGRRQATLGGPDDKLVQHSVFRNTRTGRRACIMINNGSDARQRTLTKFEGNGDGRVRIYRPFEPVEQTQLPATINIAAERLAIVVEED